MPQFLAPVAEGLTRPGVSPTSLGAALSAASLGLPRLERPLALGMDGMPSDKRPVTEGVGVPIRVPGALAVPEQAVPTRMRPPVTNIMSLASGAQFVAPSSAFAPRMLGVAPSAAPLQGVDLRLDQFDLSEAKSVSLEAHGGSWGSQAQSLDKCVSVGSTFFACIDGPNNLFKPGDQALLQKVFNPALSDRRSEGELFVPPSASFSYVDTLRTLVKQEDEVRACRERAFFSQNFAMGCPGMLFPHSWTPSFELAHGSEACGGNLSRQFNPTT